MPGITFSEDFGFDFAVRCLLTGVAYDMADSGEVLAAAEQTRPGDRDSWFDAFEALAARCQAIGEEAAGRGHRRSAAAAHLREANYRYAAFYHVLGTSDPDRHLPAWRGHRRALGRALELRDRPVEPFTVHVGGTAVRGWLFTPGGPAAARPVVIVHNLLTAPLSDVLMTGVDDAVDRGWAAVAFEGPGQGAAWFEDGVGPTDHWEEVARAVTDHVAALPHVDAERIVAVGVGDGSYLAARAAVHDRRTAALACDPGVLRPLEGALGQLPADLQQQWRIAGPDDPEATARFDRAVARAAADDPEVAFTAAKLVEQWPTASVAGVLTRLAGWDLAPVADAIACPTWIADPEAAVSFPGQSAELAGLLGPRGELVPFTSAEGAGLDCEIGAPRLRNQRLFDWLDELGLGAGTDDRTV